MAKADDRPILLITTVDIGGGKSDRIELRQGDLPEDIARAFCERHGIPASVVEPLTEHIKDHLRKAGPPATAASAPQPTIKEISPPSSVGKQAAPEAEPEEDEEATSAADSPSNAVPPAQPAKLTFAGGMNEQLYEQLSAKMLPVEDGSTLLTVSGGRLTAHASGPAPSSRGALSNRASSLSMTSNRGSQSAEGSPTRVHNRLYKHALDMRHRQDAKRRAVEDEMTASMVQRTRSSMSWISHEMMRDRTCGPFENYGEMLYAEGLEAIAMRQSKAAVVKAEREASELGGATFTPQITQLAQALWSGDDLDAQPVWQRLSIDKRARIAEHVRAMKEAKERQELAECTFRPAINRTSIKIMAERSEVQRSLHIGAHEQLYLDAERRRQKMEELKRWLPDEVTFQPAINHSKMAESALQRSLEKLGVSGTLSPRPSDTTVPPVVDRLYLSHEKTRAKLEQKRAQVYGTVDPETGKTLYKPEVGRAPSTIKRNTDTVPVNEYLYHTGMEALARKEAARAAELAAAREAASTHHTTATSARMFDRLRAKRFAQIFEYLDQGQKGEIDLVGLVRNPIGLVDNLDNEVREDVETAAALHALAIGVPLLPEGGEQDPAAAMAGLPPAPPVNAEAFSALMDKALSKRRKPRAYLVPSPAPKAPPQATYQPAINKKSRELASRLRPSEVPVHDVLHSTAEHTRQRLEAARQEAEAAALADCTFAPRVSSFANGVPVEGRALRAARTAIAAGPTIAAARSALSTTSTAAQPTPDSPNARAASARASPHLSSLIQKQAAELEAELQSALDGVALADERLGALEKASPGASSADVRATEAMLLDMLASSPASVLDSEADREVIDKLHAAMVPDAQPAQKPSAGSLGAPRASAGNGLKTGGSFGAGRRWESLAAGGGDHQ